MYSSADVRTREKVFDVVLHESPCSAAQIAKKMKLTAAAVRRHLDYLEAHGDIAVKLITPAGRAGRPARHYVLTPQAQDTTGNDYLEISKSALEKLRNIAGENMIDELAEERTSAIEKAYEAKSGTKNTLEERATVLNEVLIDLGFASSTAHRNIAGHQALQLCQAHCPIQGLAKEFPEFCQHEQDTFNKILQVDVRRLATLAQGSHVCTTHIPLDRDELPTANKLRSNKQEHDTVSKDSKTISGERKI